MSMTPEQVLRDIGPKDRGAMQAAAAQVIAKAIVARQRGFGSAQCVELTDAVDTYLAEVKRWAV